MISVGAVDNNGDITGFSSRGPTFDGRIKPEVVARGKANYVAKHDGSFGRSSGTSFSAPLVAGAAALVFQAHPNWTPLEVRQALLNTADKADDPDNTYGWGLINVMSAIEYSQKNGSCVDTCGHGLCVNDECVCEDGYYGLYCNTKKCTHLNQT